MSNIIVTGIPRSGTSFVCSLLNKIENTLALVEPLNMKGLMQCITKDDRVNFIDNYFSIARERILSEGKIDVLDFGSGTNTFSSATNDARKTTITGFKEENLNKVLAKNFRFIIKHPNAFTALLPELIDHWKCVAIVRNPVSVIASWCSLDHPLSKGYAPMASFFDEQLNDRLKSCNDDLARQIELMNWYFEKYSNNLPATNILYYEEVVISGGRCLSSIVDEADSLRETIQTMNTNKIYNRNMMARISENLIKYGGEWQKFYSKEEVMIPL